MAGKLKEGTLNAVVYALTVDDIRGVAGKLGYAFCLHGSLKNDFDICLVPWTEYASEPREVAMAIAAELRIFLDPSSWQLDEGTPAPHGRRIWTLYFGGSLYIDLSVMPRILTRSPPSWAP